MDAAFRQCLSMNDLIDNHGRRLTYLRLSVTDRCNLRCLYCMPEAMHFLPATDLLEWHELERLVRASVDMGITKVRITGGEPFLREGLMDFLRTLRRIAGLHDLSLTTNGVLTTPFVPELKALGVSVNLSLDTLNRETFKHLTRRNELDAVMHTFEALLHHKVETKLNAVVMSGLNTADIVPLAELTRRFPVSVRYIEEMPFNGIGDMDSVVGTGDRHSIWTHHDILGALQAAYPDMHKLSSEPESTSVNYRISNFAGTVGIIAAASRTFCGTCNRLRLTAKGTLQTCLYEHGGLDVRALLRQGINNDGLQAAMRRAVSHRYKDGFEAEANRPTPVSESMSTIGG